MIQPKKNVSHRAVINTVGLVIIGLSVLQIWLVSQRQATIVVIVPKSQPTAVAQKSASLPVVDDQFYAPPLSTSLSIAKGAISHILEYHYIRSGVDPKVDPIGYNLSVTATQLDSEIAAMKAGGYTSETMAEYMAGKGGAKTVIMTFDDGYEDFYTAAYPILKKYGWTATIYIISGKIGNQYMTWDQLRELKANGIEIGAHTVDHIDLATATVAQQHHQIFDSKATIQTQVGGNIISFCYPSGKYNAATINLLKQAGFTSAATEISGGVSHLDDPFQLHRLRVPPSLTVPRLLGELKQ